MVGSIKAVFGLTVAHLAPRILALMLLVPVLLSLSPLSPATYAYHVKPGLQWPNYSFYWLSSRQYHSGSPVSVVSNNCNFTLWEQSAIANATNQTANTPELGDMTQGYWLSWAGCGGAMGDLDDILLNYMDQITWNSKYPTSTAGGITLHSPTFSNDPTRGGWCGRMGTYSPCGDHYVVIDLNMYKICGQTAPCNLANICGGPNPACPSSGKYDLVRLLMHEMGHATGLDDHCSDSGILDSIMNDGTSFCNSGKWTATGQWYSIDRQGLYSVYHPHDDKTILGPSGPIPSGGQWQAVKIISDGPGGLQIGGTPMPRLDINQSGRIFAGWYDSGNKVWNMAYSDDDGLTWIGANQPSYSALMASPGQAAMLAHNNVNFIDEFLTLYTRFPNYSVFPTVLEIWRQTWNGTNGTWSPPRQEYVTPAVSLGILLVAHSGETSSQQQYAMAWTEYSGGTPSITFTLLSPSGSFGVVETVAPGAARGLVFDENGNPKVVYRVLGTPGQETGTGARRTRINGVWGPEQTFTIDGLTEPDAFLLLEGEQSSHFYGDCAPGLSGMCNSGTYAGIDHYALKHVASPLTFRYRKRQGSPWNPLFCYPPSSTCTYPTPGVFSWTQQDIDFATLPMAITGPNAGMYNAHGLTRLMYQSQSLVVGTVWTSSSVSPFPSDLWFIR